MSDFIKLWIDLTIMVLAYRIMITNVDAIGDRLLTEKEDISTILWAFLGLVTFAGSLAFAINLIIN